MSLPMYVLAIHKSRKAIGVLFVALACVMVSGPAFAQSGFYRYVDENGRVRYTDNPANVPPEQYQEAPLDASLLRTDPAADTRIHDVREPQRIVVNYNAQGGRILVNAVLDYRYPVVFQLDTGASRSMITGNDARALNIPLASADVVKGLIADGSIVEMPVVRLASIGLGEAVVDNMDVAVGKLRLLGMDFLQHFELNINAPLGQLVLVPKEPVAGSNGAGRESESDAVRQDREQAKREIENQIAQLRIAIQTCHGTIEEYEGDIEALEKERENAEAALNKARRQGRFQGSGVSRDRLDESTISRIEKNIKEIESVVQNRRDLITLNEEQVEGMQSRIIHLRKLLSRIN